MKRYIDADVLKRNIRVNLMPNVDVDGTVTVEDAERYFINLINKTSTSDVQEVKHGYWIEERCGEGIFDYYFRCSECGGTTPPRAYPVAPDYCPNCPAKMDGGDS